jgi:DNA polymerase III alpha subunit
VNYDQFGQAYTTEAELCDMLYKQPDLKLGLFKVALADHKYNRAVHETYAPFEKLKQYQHEHISIDTFDQNNQCNWHMPTEYKELDIAAYILGLCSTDPELQRVGQELLLYQERDLFNLLRYLKYFVDTMRANKVVWGLGRGSSTASYVLYLMGVHKINSMFYDLPIEEFLK